METVKHWINKIPIKITAIRYREVENKHRRLAMSIVLIASLLLVEILFIRLHRYSYETWQMTLIKISMLLVALVFGRFILMFTLDEKLLYQQYLTYKDNPRIPLDKLWDIAHITPEGIIIVKEPTFGGYHRQMIIKLERTSTIGKDLTFENNHYTAVSLFIRYYMQKGYRIRKYNLSVSDPNLEPLVDTEIGASQLVNARMKNLINRYIQYIKGEFRGKHNRSIEYWVINSMRSTDRLLQDVQESFKLLGNSLYKPTICDEKEINKFLYAFFKLRYIDTKQLIINKLPTEKTVVLDKVIPVEEDISIFHPVETTTDKALASFLRLKEKIERGDL